MSIFFEGNSIDIPAAGPKISVALQSIEGGVFRVQWRLEGVSASASNLENRTFSTRQLIYGPISPQVYGSHLPTGENSLVALGSDGSTILWGVNWQDAFGYYQGTSFSPSTEGANMIIQFGLFLLRAGQAVIIDPIVDGGGGDETPTVYISTPSVSVAGTSATITWSDNPSYACDTFQWGTSTSYGNTINTCSHSVNLSNLQSGVRYYYRITACASGYHCGIYSSSFYPARQLLGNTWFQTTGSVGTPSSPGDCVTLGCWNFPWQGNFAEPWQGGVFQIGSNPWNYCEPIDGHQVTELTSSCNRPLSSPPYQYVINPYDAFQVKGSLDNSYQNPGLLWSSQISQGCGFPWYVQVSGSTSIWSYPSNTDLSPSCPNGSPSWSSPHRQNLLDRNQHFTMTMSRTAPESRPQTLSAWWIGWAIVNFDVDFFVILDRAVSFYAPDSCGNWAWRTSNFLELEPYLYMQSMASNSLWGAVQVGSSPVVVAMSGSPVTATIFGCSTSAPYWIYVRTHPIQLDACFPSWCPEFTYTTMYQDIVSAENIARISPLVDGTMMNFQAGIEAANYAMLWWATNTEWWGSG